jgi:hypothetical protein
VTAARRQRAPALAGRPRLSVAIGRSLVFGRWPARGLALAVLRSPDPVEDPRDGHDGGQASEGENRRRDLR